VIYAIYFKYNDNVDAGEPLIGVCPPDQLNAIQDVIMRVKTEWREKD
ncbi:MAG: biotin attachment protein, partial [Desulfovibrio sp.]|nr:biotin attachment protein [Desulfovibrio sp.]